MMLINNRNGGIYAVLVVICCWLLNVNVKHFIKINVKVKRNTNNFVNVLTN